MKNLYPEIEPYHANFFSADEHKIYYEESGNKDGIPIIFLHGGPGSGTDPKHRRFFNPEKYRIVLMDQRGCGKSTPFASLEKNTTWDLVADIERLRELLNVNQWVVFGGSWGSTLALAYAESYPDRVKALILRGIFLAREEELNWFFKSGANFLFPEEWERFVQMVKLEERDNLIEAYYKLLMSENCKAAAKAWSRWEGMLVRLEVDPEFVAYFTEDDHAVAVARIECHYFKNKAFFSSDNYLIENAYKIASIPTVIIHGRYDVICPFKNAWDLSKALPNAKLKVIGNAGHLSSEPGILDALIEATDDYKE